VVACTATTDERSIFTDGALFSLLRDPSCASAVTRLQLLRPPLIWALDFHVPRQKLYVRRSHTVLPEIHLSAGAGFLGMHSYQPKARFK